MRRGFPPDGRRDSWSGAKCRYSGALNPSIMSGTPGSRRFGMGDTDISRAETPDRVSRNGPIATGWRRLLTPAGVCLALLLLGVFDSAQLYLFERFRGEPMSAAGALARNFTFWALLVPFAWGLLRWLAEPVRGAPDRRSLSHASVALSVAFAHIAVWVLAREVLAHGHFRLSSYPVLIAKFGLARGWLDLAVYAALFGLLRQASDSKAQVRPPTDGSPAGTRGERGGVGAGNRDRVLLQKAGGKAYLVDPERLEWVEASGDYMRLHLVDDDLLIRITLKELDRLLGDRFVRVSRSAIVCVDRIREIQPSGRDRHEIVLDSGARVTLTASHRERLQERLSISL